MTNAAFSLVGYDFSKASFDFSEIADSLELHFNPSGRFLKERGTFLLRFVFVASCNGRQVISVECHAEFKFNEVHSLNDIPDYFFSNSIPIIFPYVRAFVSTISVQSNKGALVLPTLNLSGLKRTLKDNTTEE